jgi:putative membrane protein
MKTAADLTILVVGVLHLWILILEMFLWQKPLGLRTFRNTPERAEATAVLAANQGLYNGFLAAGLLISFCFSHPEVSLAFQTYFLCCVLMAGLYGAWSVNRRIFWIQGLPALLGLLLLRLSSD